MRTNFIKFAMIIFVLSNLLLVSAQEMKQFSIQGDTNKSPFSYNIGEEMTFSFRVKTNGDCPENIYFKYFRRGDDGKTFSGQASACNELILKTSLDRAGFVGIDVSLIDSNGKAILNKGKKVAFYAGAAVTPFLTVTVISSK